MANQQRRQSECAGSTFLFTFPFWVYVDRESPPSVAELNWGGAQIRIYPPFRSAAANYMSLPAIDPQHVPYLPSATRVTIPPVHFAPMAVVPLLRTDGTEGFPVLAISTPQWEELPRTFPMDSLRVDVLNSTNTPLLANALVSKLLAAIRWHSGQWWIGHSVGVFPGLLRQWFPISSDGTILFQGKSERTTQVRTVDGSEAAIGQELWNRVVADVSAGTEPDLSFLLLLDARYHGYTGDFRRGILDAAVACEQAKDDAFEQVWSRLHPGERYSRGRILKGYDLDKQVDQDLKRLISRSYREEFPHYWSSISHLWSARGNVAHGARVFYRDSGTRVDVGDLEFVQIVVAADHCVRWIQGLGKGDVAN